MTEKEPGFDAVEGQESEPATPSEIGAQWLEDNSQVLVSLQKTAGEVIEFPSELKGRDDVGAEIAGLLLLATGVAAAFGGQYISHELAPYADAMRGSWEEFPVRFYGLLTSVIGSGMAFLALHSLNKVKSS